MRSDKTTNYSYQTTSITSYFKPVTASTLISYLNTNGFWSISTYFNKKTLDTITSYVNHPTINTIASYIQPIALNTLSSLFTPITTFFTAQKTLTSGEPTKKRRKRTSFLANITASLALPDTPKETHQKASVKSEGCDQKPKNPDLSKSAMTLFSKSSSSNKIPVCVQMKELENKCRELEDSAELDNLILQKVNLVDDYIKEHAARRVDLFFYLLLAVYGKQVVVTKEATEKQHGISSKQTGTQACHCSLFPHIKLQAISTSSWFFSKTASPTLSDTHFDDSLNMTVELPNAVNAFDGRLEGRYQPTKYTKAALAILNKAALNEIDPIAGMNAFLEIMNEFFSDFEKNKLKKHKCKMPKATKKIWEYEKAGTFLAAKKDQLSISEDYLYLMLRLSPKEKQDVLKNHKSLAGFYQRIQEEILTSKAVKKQSRRHPKLMSK